MSTNEIPSVFFSRIREDKYLLVCFQYQNEFFKLDDYFTVVSELAGTVGDLLSEIVDSVTRQLKKMKDERSVQAVDAESVYANFYSNGKLVPTECLCLDLPFWLGDEMHLRIGNIKYNIVLNGPCVDFLTLPRIMVVGFPVSPFSFKTSYANLDDCEFLWYRKRQHVVEHIANGYWYTPVPDDVGCKLKLVCIPGNGVLKGPKAETTSKNCVQPGAEKFPFEDRHKFTTAAPVRGSFRIMSYNILADYCVGSTKLRKERFPYCPSEALDINYRKLLLHREIIGYNADIICLQEVDKNVYKDDLLRLLSARYDSAFIQKASTIPEGLAFFYDKSKFWLKEQHGIVLSRELQINPWLRDLWTIFKPIVEKLSRFLKAATSLQVAVLISLEEEEQCVIVANTHLRSWPEPDFFRALQATIAVTYLECVISEISKKIPEKKISVVFCGDFNSTPNSSVYELMVNRFVPEDHATWSEGRKRERKGINLSHSLNFRSAYGTPEFTNYTHEFIGCLDYIFYQMDTLQVLQVVPLPGEEEVQEHEAIPSVIFPSDHLALIADLCWA